MKSSPFLRFILSAVLSIVMVGFSTIALPAWADEQLVDFRRDIRPILSNTCYTCHGPDDRARESDLRLDIKRSPFLQLDSGEIAIVPGDIEASSLYQRLTSDSEDEIMPPPESGKKLTPQEIDLFKRWIEQGASWQKHWSFVRPKKSPLPKVEHPQSIRNPLDHFVISRLSQAGLTPSPEATKETLIRRLTLDLTGLPPTIEEIDAFLKETSDKAYENLVERLLDSPRYGEQMTRYWLDVARYGDTHGLHLDNVRSIWPYRDWVIKAFNDNMPFDQFTVEQMAGDLLPEATIAQRVATGFNRCNVSTSEGGSIAEEYRVRYAVDRVETMGTVWLGLTTGCAVCHEHKFDPISQKEFYQFFAYFGNVDENPMDGNAILPPPTIRLISPEQEESEKEIQKQLAEIKQKITAEIAKIDYVDPQPEEKEPVLSLSAWKEAEKAKKKSSLPKPIQKLLKLEVTKRTDEQKKLLRDYYLEHVYSKTRETFDPLHKQLAEVKKQQADLEKAIPKTMVMKDKKEPAKAHILIRGAYDKRGEEVTPGVPSAFNQLPPEAPANRLGLARWLVDPDNPLPARVTVNRFWQHYFGQGIVLTANDFGSQGQLPTHPQLLDWLAVEFVESGWNVKHLQKLIVMSATYRQSSQMRPIDREKDPENMLLARGPRFRMDAEMVRDNALLVSGLLIEKIGGPSVKPYQPSGLWKAVGYSGSNTVNFVQDKGSKLYRRSMYTFWKRTSPPPTMTTFDAPSREYCIVSRARTNTPLQALVLMNDVQFVEAARHLAQAMLAKAGPADSDRVVFAFRRATGRRPQEDELQIFLKAFQDHFKEYQQNPDAAAKLITIGDSPHDQSMDKARFAAWIMVAHLILNLDETITKG